MIELLEKLKANIELQEFADLRTTGLELLEKIRSEAASLERDSFKLQCLENAGVDNWDGYDWAMEEFYADEDDDD